ncbi:hypothetical protein ACELLULO517_07495 [Acidisoma cellulosilytica]|uniref:Uncharacterized protein n=1 Tax=Acidisoma cellulosilyticum TaxID=2802395 RepID=A0A963Z044_9PROT|nr:hypothetical protein [Acidisoma cellulosilyticum]MCB8880074.1 hypothetical protein [Acidisoma cellulosilyticum]
MPSPDPAEARETALSTFELHKTLSAVIHAGITSGDDNTSRLARNIAHDIMRKFPTIAAEKCAEQMPASMQRADGTLASIDEILRGEGSFFAKIGASMLLIQNYRAALAQEKPHE